MKKICIELEEQSSIVTIKLPTDNNTSITKFISIDDLTELLQHSKDNLTTRETKKQKKRILNNTELLPANNGTSILQIVEDEFNNKLVVLKKNACRHDFAYHKDIFNDVGIPTLLFFLSINKNNIVYKCRLFAIKGSVVTTTTELYHYPFTNVSAYGEVCFGANGESLTLKNYSSLAFLPDKFFMMPSRHELSYQNALDLKMRPLLEVLSGMDFEDEFLTKTNYKYEDVIKTIIP